MIKPKMKVPTVVLYLVFVILILGVFYIQWYVRAMNAVSWMPANPKVIQVYIWGPNGDNEIHIPNSEYSNAVKSLRSGFIGISKDCTPVLPWADKDAIALAPIGYMKLDGLKFSWFKYDKYIDNISHYSR